jgi:sigma-E factor negative regulatory protein RseA
MHEILELNMNEQISALADDEIAIDDAAHLIAAMQVSGSAADAWSQYHLIGDALRGTNTLSANFKQNLMAKLEQEPTVLAPNAAIVNQNVAHQAPVQANVKTPIAWSIAASFSAVIAVGWMVFQTQVTNNIAPVAVATIETPTAVEVSSEQTIPAEYLMAHQASAPTASSYYIQSASYSE